MSSIKVEAVPETVPRSHEDRYIEFTSLDNMLIVDVLVDHFMNELTNLKETIKALTESYNYMYLDKKYLIAQFIECHDQSEKTRLKEKLVSFLLQIKVKENILIFEKYILI